MEALIHICQFYLPMNLDFGHEFMNDTIYDIIREMAPSLNDTMLECMWQYDVDNCSELFRPILTDEGLCFTFNAINSHEMYTKE